MGKRWTKEEASELFNYLHAKARNVVERTFGIMKNKWQILKEIPLYSLETQAYTIIACCVLHNMRKGKASCSASRILSNRSDRYNPAAYRSMKDFRAFLTKDMWRRWELDARFRNVLLKCWMFFNICYNFMLSVPMLLIKWYKLHVWMALHVLGMIHL